MACRSLADLLYGRIWMPSWSVHWVLIWLNLSTSSPVCQPLCLQLSGFAAQASDWLTSARLACVFMHAGLIISPWPWIYPALRTFSPHSLIFIFHPCVSLASVQWRPTSRPLHPLCFTGRDFQNINQSDERKMKVFFDSWCASMLFKQSVTSVLYAYLRSHSEVLVKYFKCFICYLCFCPQ